MNNELRKYDSMAKEVKNWKTSTVYQSFYSTVLSYCMKCRKNTKSKTKRVAKTNKKKPLLLSKLEVCGSNISRFIKEKEVNGLLNRLGIKILFLSDLPIMDHNAF